MSKLSNLIEEFIKSLITKTDDGVIEIQRNELAQYFDCAPSQINYVLTTRFNSEKGYYLESRRGGGGYIKIIKVNINNDTRIYNIIANIIGESITKAKAYSLIDNFIEEKLISEREGNIMKSAISDRVLYYAFQNKNQVRASILKDMLLVLIQ